MGKWFKHRHYWCQTSGDNSIHSRGEENLPPHRLLRLEQCSCGAVRSIEYGAYAAPVIREAIYHPATDSVNRDKKP
jgi:hypothetical protein